MTIKHNIVFGPIGNFKPPYDELGRSMAKELANDIDEGIINMITDELKLFPTKEFVESKKTEIDLLLSRIVETIRKNLWDCVTTTEYYLSAYRLVLVRGKSLSVEINKLIIQHGWVVRSAQIGELGVLKVEVEPYTPCPWTTTK